AGEHERRPPGEGPPDRRHRHCPGVRGDLAAAWRCGASASRRRARRSHAERRRLARRRLRGHVRPHTLPRLTPEGPAPIELDQAVVHALLQAFDRSDWLEMTVTIGEDRLHVSRRAATERGATTASEPGAAPAPEETASPESVHAEPAHATP